MNNTVSDPVLSPIVASKFVHPPKGMWRVFWGHRGQTQGSIYSRLMCSHVHVSSGLKYVWCTISLLTKTRRQNTEIPWCPGIDFLVKPGAKINQLWGKKSPGPHLRKRLLLSWDIWMLESIAKRNWPLSVLKPLYEIVGVYFGGVIFSRSTTEEKYKFQQFNIPN